MRNDKGELVRVMIMEHIEGSSLSDEIGLLSARGNRLDYEDSMEIVLELCEALEYMSDQDPPCTTGTSSLLTSYLTRIRSGPVAPGSQRESGGPGHQRLQGASEGWSPPERMACRDLSLTCSASASSPGTC